jgi:archaellum component FlaG (FlaF/FlaG flagellin family)
MKLTKMSLGATAALVSTALILTVFTTGLLSVNQSISSSGTVTAVNVGVYSDSACIQNLTSIDWGTLSPGDSVTRTIYVKNTGNAPIAITMTKINWNPSTANGPITITWNTENWSLGAGNSTAATLTLSISSSISGITDFSVDIVITGTEK